MRTPAGLWAVLVLAILATGAIVVAHPAAAAGGSSSPITITPVNPAPGSQTPDRTPTIQASFADTAGKVDPSTVILSFDGDNCTGFTGFRATSSGVSCPVPMILALKNGVHNVTVSVGDDLGNIATVSWNFTLNPNATVPTAPLFSLNFRTVLVDLGIAMGVAGVGFLCYIWYLKQTTRFAFRKYFATHPIQRSYLVLYIPAGLAVLFVFVGLVWVTSTPNLPPESIDLVFVGGIFIGLTPFGIDSRRQLALQRARERAFAQFLFEMADAMRGGLDPAKALTELAKTQTNILRRPLRIAADGIRIGRPFDVVLQDLAKQMKSPLITRYADLIAEATTVGGDTAIVIHRAAKDMDDFVKIEEERNSALALPVAVIYIAFAVLIAVLFALLYIAPSLGTLNIGFLVAGNNPLKGKTTVSVPPLAISTLHERFFELTLINSIGTGAIIGAFAEGRVRYGIVHSLALVAATTVLFLIIFP